MRGLDSESAIDKVLSVFFRSPSARIHLRELARQAKLSPPATATACKALAKEGVLAKQETPPTISYVALRDAPEFRMRKRVWNLQQLQRSGVVEDLAATGAEAVIVAGSYSKGEDTEKDSIELVLVNPQRRTPPLTAAEKMLARPIRIIVLQKPFKREVANSAANGIVVHGRWSPL